MQKNNYIVVKDRHPRISEVLNDCVNLCVPTSRGESLASILQKICNKISDNQGVTYTFANTDTVTFNVDANNVVTATAIGGGGGGDSYTDEQARDAIALMIASGTHTGILFSSSDVSDSLSSSIVTQMSLDVNSSGIKLVNDEASPGNREFYSTSSTGTKGWRALEAGDFPFSWNILGNAGTVDGTNFLGTTDNIPLTFRVNNQQSGKITSVGLTYFGYQAGASNPSLGGSTAIGYRALASLLPSNTLSNLAIGYEALTNYLGNIGNNGNIAIGYRASYLNTNGPRNVSLGIQALHNLTLSPENTALGTFAGEWMSIGTGVNAIVGSNAMRHGTINNYNAVLGGYALLYATGVVSSINLVSGGTGYTTATVTISAPDANPTNSPTSGTQATATAIISSGSIVGFTITNPGLRYSSATVTITGDGTGASATATVLGSNENSVVGQGSFAFLANGQGNSGLGRNSGVGAGSNESSEIDDYCTFIGSYASRHSSIATTTKLTNATAIGYNAKVSASNSLILGSTSTNVGIGVTAPVSGYKLQVLGTILSTELHVRTTGTSPLIRLQDSAGTNKGALYYNVSFNRLGLSNNLSAGVTTFDIGGVIKGQVDADGFKANIGMKMGNFLTPDPSAILDIESTSKGMLPPRMSAIQAEAITSPAEGLLLYSLDGTGSTITSKGWWGYDGSTWLDLTGSGSGSYTFNNGITEALGIVKLGGALTQNTSITGATHTYSFSILEASNISLIAGASGPGNEITFDDGSDNMTINAANGDLLIEAANDVKINSLNVGTANDRLVGQTSGTSALGYVAIGSGLSLSSGTLTASGLADSITKTILTANATINNPTGISEGQKVVHKITQGGTGSYTVTWDTKYKFSLNFPEPTLSEDVGAIDYITFIYDSSDDLYYCIHQSLGFNETL